jgi:enoyl-CoA hydratase
MFASEVLTLEVEGPIATLWLDRPEARNALGKAFWRDLGLAAREIAGLDDVRVLVIAAKGPHFSVGLDLKEFSDITARETISPATANAARYRGIRDWQASVTAVAELPMPVIAAVHGYCIGGGVDLITACDVRLCSSDAVFSVREAKVAIVADLGTLQRLPGIVSAGHLAELAFTGKDIDASRAAEIGLVNDVRGGDAITVLESAYGLAHEIAANSPLAVRGTKAVLAANDGHTVDEGLEFVARWNTMYLNSNDLREALTAFLERRAPNFTGD